MATPTVRKDGRKFIWDKNRKKTVPYSRYVVEHYLGIMLSDNEQVHHKDGNPTNDSISNLDVVTKEEHYRLHDEGRHFKRKYYDKNTTCFGCGKTFLWTAKSQMNFYRNASRKNNTRRKGPYCCAKCAGFKKK